MYHNHNRLERVSVASLRNEITKYLSQFKSYSRYGNENRILEYTEIRVIYGKLYSYPATARTPTF